MKKIAVYCGASIGNNKAYEDAAIQLAKWLVKNDYGLVYGGGNVGLMGILADTVSSEHGYTLEVMPTFLKERELAHDHLDEFIIVDSMHDRKKIMIDKADCYIALPGGLGTLEEISEVISWGRIGEHQNPCILFNVNGYYDYLGLFFDHMVQEQFLTTEDREKILITDSLSDIEVFIKNYQHLKLGSTINKNLITYV